MQFSIAVSASQKFLHSNTNFLSLGLLAAAASLLGFVREFVRLFILSIRPDFHIYNIPRYKLPCMYHFSFDMNFDSKRRSIVGALRTS